MQEQLHFLVMDDDPSIGSFVRQEILAKLPIAEGKIRWKFRLTEEDAIRDIEQSEQKLQTVFLDINMQVADANGVASGSADAGYRVFERIIGRNKDLADPAYRVQCVFFFSQNRYQPERVQHILDANPGHELKVEFVEKPRTLHGVTAAEREATVRVEKILKTLFRLEHGE